MHIEVPHSCGRTHFGWQSLAECTWSNSAYVVGDGPFALIARCDMLTVSLYENSAEARRRKRRLDSRGCCKRCQRDHVLAVLGDEDPAPLAESAVDWLRTS